MTTATDSTVSKQWATRPDDQRFLTLEALRNTVAARTNASRAINTTAARLKAYGTAEGELIVDTELGPKTFSNWSFGQMAQVANAPGSYLRRLPSELAAECLNHGITNASRFDNAIYVNKDEDLLRAITSQTYGRIYDIDIVNKVMDIQNGRWKVPAASYASQDPKRATTLYASDRDIFIFLVDDQHPIEVNGRQIFRGFYVWNSEVGSATFGLATFTYDRVCDNRIIWGIDNKTELRIKHTAGAPERFIHEAKPALIEYSEASAKPLIDRITRAHNIEIGKNEDEVQKFLQKRGLSLAMAKSSIQMSKAEGDNPTTAWGIVQGMTALARSNAHADARVGMEREAGKILDLVTA